MVPIQEKAQFSNSDFQGNSKFLLTWKIDET